MKSILPDIDELIEKLGANDPVFPFGVRAAKIRGKVSDLEEKFQELDRKAADLKTANVQLRKMVKTVTAAHKASEAQPSSKITPITAKG